MKSDLQDDFANKKTSSNEAIGLATALNGADKWVQIFPAKQEWVGIDGRGPYRLSNPDAVIAASKISSNLKYAMIDRDHARQLSKPGTPVKAAAWFQDYEIREDGSIWGKADWTPSATRELSEKEFRYFSPTFRFDPDTGEIFVITGGSMTNTPNFEELEALASQQEKPSTTTKETTPMKKELLALAAKLGLDPETVTEEEILAAAEKAHDQLEKLTEDVANLKKVLKVAEDAEIDAVVDTASQLIGKKPEDTPDPEKFVPKAMYDELATRVDNVEKQTATDKAEEAVASAIKGGKITPANKDWAIGYATQNLEGFNDFVKNAPNVISEEETAAAQKRQDENGGLSDVDHEVARQLGLSSDAFKEPQKDKAAA